MNIEQAIREYLPNVIHLSLATCAGDKPWVCEVHYAYDDDLNLYFHSRTTRRHSAEIATNPHVAGNIIKPHVIGEKVRGVYFEGTCSLLDAGKENDTAFKFYGERFNWKLADGEKAPQLYKITVNTFYIFDELESTPGKKHELPWNK